MGEGAGAVFCGLLYEKKYDFLYFSTAVAPSSSLASILLVLGF